MGFFNFFLTNEHLTAEPLPSASGTVQNSPAEAVHETSKSLDMQRNFPHCSRSPAKKIFRESSKILTYRQYVPEFKSEGTKK
jgi:hypothetical protein